jgi:hypothetical protein
MNVVQIAYLATTHETEKTGFFKKKTGFFEKPVSCINVNLCYGSLEKLGIVGLKLLAINLCGQCDDFYPFAELSCC